MSGVDYEICGADSDLGDAPALEPELLVLPEWPNRRGKATAFLMHAMSTGENDEFNLSHQVYDKDGNVIRLKQGGRVYRYLARVTRDGDGQRIWSSDKACEDRLKGLPVSITNKMVEAADRVNYGSGARSAAEAVADAQGKSEETSNSS